MGHGAAPEAWGAPRHPPPSPSPWGEQPQSPALASQYPKSPCVLDGPRVLCRTGGIPVDFGKCQNCLSPWHALGFGGTMLHQEEPLEETFYTGL